jgi:hypothetical protein
MSSEFFLPIDGLTDLKRFYSPALARTRGAAAGPMPRLSYEVSYRTLCPLSSKISENEPFFHFIS